MLLNKTEYDQSEFLRAFPRRKIFQSNRSYFKAVNSYIKDALSKYYVERARTEEIIEILQPLQNNYKIVKIGGSYALRQNLGFFNNLRKRMARANRIGPNTINKEKLNSDYANIMHHLIGGEDLDLDLIKNLKELFLTSCLHGERDKLLTLSDKFTIDKFIEFCKTIEDEDDALIKNLSIKLIKQNPNLSLDDFKKLVDFIDFWEIEEIALEYLEQDEDSFDKFIKIIDLIQNQLNKNTFALEYLKRNKSYLCNADKIDHFIDYLFLFNSKTRESPISIYFQGYQNKSFEDLINLASKIALEIFNKKPSAIDEIFEFIKLSAKALRQFKTEKTEEEIFVMILARQFPNDMMYAEAFNTVILNQKDTKPEYIKLLIKHSVAMLKDDDAISWIISEWHPSLETDVLDIFNGIKERAPHEEISRILRNKQLVEENLAKLAIETLEAIFGTNFNKSKYNICDLFFYYYYNSNSATGFSSFLSNKLKTEIEECVADLPTKSNKAFFLNKTHAFLLELNLPECIGVEKLAQYLLKGKETNASLSVKDATINLDGFLPEKTIEEKKQITQEFEEMLRNKSKESILKFFESLIGKNDFQTVSDKSKENLAELLENDNNMKSLALLLSKRSAFDVYSELVTSSNDGCAKNITTKLFLMLCSTQIKGWDAVIYRTYYNQILAPISNMPESISGGDVTHGGDASLDPVLNNKTINLHKLNLEVFLERIKDSLEEGDQEKIMEEICVDMKTDLTTIHSALEAKVFEARNGRQYEDLTNYYTYFICRQFLLENESNVFAKKVIGINEQFKESLEKAIEEIRNSAIKSTATPATTIANKSQSEYHQLGLRPDSNTSEYCKEN